ncbi:hypothetical protein KHP62_02380 [Rhodobacteraceae bacterium NNCM2]|nr:hypothetical protein [Coraliihabitans acroporae]
MAPKPGQVRLAAFSEIFGEKKETLRSLINRGDDPFSSSPPKHGHRTFGAIDVLDYELFLALVEDERGRAAAGNRVSNSGASRAFFAAMDRGETVKDLALIAYKIAERDPIFGFRVIPGSYVLHFSEIEENLERQTDRYGERYQSERRNEPTIRLGLRQMSIVPIWPVYKIAQERCAAAGYTLNGSFLSKNPSENDYDSGDGE